MKTLTHHLARCFMLCSIMLMSNTWAQVLSVSPTTFTLNSTTGGTVSTTATLGALGVTASGGTLCGQLIFGSLGIKEVPPCNTPTIFGTRAATQAGSTFTQNFTPADLAAAAAALTAAGLPNNRFYFVIQVNTAPTVITPATSRFIALQINITYPAPPPPAGSLAKVSPALADVASTGSSSVAIRYTLAAADAPLGGQFCSALSDAYPPNGVANGNPCAAPLGFSNSVVSYSAASLQASENLNVPQSIAQQAYQAARASGNSIFYFVRQFSSGKYAVVQLRLSGGSAANAPLALTEVKLAFRPGNQPLAFIQRGQAVPRFNAQIRYRGAGLLRARWELVQPGDILPGNLDLSAEASLSPQERALQQRYQLLQTFHIYLQPSGNVTIPGPDPSMLPTDIDGQYQILLRIEATDALQADASGGSAPFVLPVLRYFVGVPGTSGASPARDIAAITLLAPAASADTGTGAINFQWLPLESAQFYRLEIEENGSLVFAARIRAGGDSSNSYQAPPLLREQATGFLTRWRLMALDAQGRAVGQSEWRGLRLGK